MNPGSLARRAGKVCLRMTVMGPQPTGEGSHADSTDWQKILLICNEALGLDTAHRGEFLEKASAGDPKLRHDLYAVMDASVDADSTFDSVLTGLEQLLESLKPAPATGVADGQQVATPEPACPTQFTSSPFASLATETLSSLLSVMEPREYAEGELLIRQGDSAEYLLLIISGTALARVRDMPGDRPPVGEFGPGDIVGEIALITEEPRTADVIAGTPMRALRLPSAEFDRLALRHPDLRVVLTNVVADRLGWARLRRAWRQGHPRLPHRAVRGPRRHGRRVRSAASRDRRYCGAQDDEPPADLRAGRAAPFPPRSLDSEDAAASLAGAALRILQCL